MNSYDSIVRPNAVPILMVDDRPENLISLEAMLRRDGLETLKAQSAREALELLLHRDVALALLDVQMPEMDGFELAEMLRGNERTRHIPIIFLTAGSTDRTRRFRGYEAGAVDFLEKPLEPDILRSKVNIFFELYRQRQQIGEQMENLRAIATENLRLLKESRAAAEALQDADRRKDEFLATLAHELRNPLAPIRNGLQILRLSKGESERAEEVRGMMDRQMNHLVRLIDDLLDVSRVSQGKIDLRKEVMPLQDAVSAAVEASRPLVEAGGHSFNLVMPEAPIHVEGDMTRLAQVVSNLINNAAKYTPEGGHITVTVQPAGLQAEIIVADDGLGITPDMLPKVFDLFTQVDSHLERSQGGLGVGLALVRKLVEMHGGVAVAESDGPGKGSRFTVRLPLSRAAKAAKAAQRTKPMEGPMRPLKVLIVDDNVDSAQTTRWMLELIGYPAEVSHDGREAIALATGDPPDVIFLDIGMPGMSGYDVCRAMRQVPALKDAVIVAQTGWGQASDRQEAFDAGFDRHITKPVSLDQVTRLLEEVQKTRPAHIDG